MRGSSFGVFSGSSLTARGGPARTFGGLAVFAVLTLLGLGSYLIEDQITDPMQGQAPALLFAALLIATAVILLYSLLRQAARARSAAIVARRKINVRSSKESVAVARRRTLEWRQERKDLSFHDRYVDHARIRL